MPLYDYKCSECDTVFEKSVRIADMSEKQQCPSCQKQTGEKFIGGAPLIGDPIRLGITKIPGGFREVLEKIDKKTPGSQLKNNSTYYH